jgi:hypothetical protein
LNSLISEAMALGVTPDELRDALDRQLGEWTKEGKGKA